MERKFFWLKLKKDFFKRHDIKIVEDMENGKDYLLFYLKLLCESVGHNGNLRFSDTIPYNEKMLSTITGTNVDIVRSAMKVFIGLNMIEILDDQTIYMREVEKMIGSETDSAERVRRHRALKQGQALQCNGDVTKCNVEIDKELDKMDYESNNINTACACACEEVVLNHLSYVVEVDAYRQQLESSEVHKDNLPLFDEYVNALMSADTEKKVEALLLLDQQRFAEIFNALLRCKRNCEEIGDLYRYVWKSVLANATQKKTNSAKRRE